jgi:hypothetical protein
MLWQVGQRYCPSVFFSFVPGVRVRPHPSKPNDVLNDLSCVYFLRNTIKSFIGQIFRASAVIPFEKLYQFEMDLLILCGSAISVLVELKQQTYRRVLTLAWKISNQRNMLTFQ